MALSSLRVLRSSSGFSHLSSLFSPFHCFPRLASCSRLAHDGGATMLTLLRQEKLKRTASVLFFARRLFAATRSGTAMKLSRSNPAAASSSSTTTKATALLPSPPSLARTAHDLRPRHHHVRCVLT